MDAKAKLHNFTLDSCNETITYERPAGNIIVPIHHPIRRDIVITCHYELAQLAMLTDILGKGVGANDDRQVARLEVMVHAAASHCSGICPFGSLQVTPLSAPKAYMHSITSPSSATVMRLVLSPSITTPPLMPWAIRIS